MRQTSVSHTHHPSAPMRTRTPKTRRTPHSSAPARWCANLAMCTICGGKAATLALRSARRSKATSACDGLKRVAHRLIESTTAPVRGSQGALKALNALNARVFIKSGKLISSKNDWFHDFLGLILADEFLHWLHFADLLLCLFALVRVRLLLCCVLPVALVYPVESQGGAGIDH